MSFNYKNMQQSGNIVYVEQNYNIEDATFTFLIDDALEYPSTEAINIMPLHFHTYHEMFFVTDGEVEIQFETEKITLRKNDLLIISPHTTHRVIYSDTGERYNLNFTVQKNLIKSNFHVYEMLSKPLSLPYILMHDAPEIGERLNKIIYFLSSDNGVELGIHFHEFILCILKLTKSATDNFTMQENIATDSDFGRMYVIHRIINTKYDKNISLDEIAKKLHLSVKQTNRIIKKLYNCNFGELVTKLKIQQAERLLTGSDIIVSDIAQMVGYNSICGFYNAFKKYHGCSPIEYRKKNSIKQKVTIKKYPGTGKDLR